MLTVAWGGAGWGAWARPQPPYKKRVLEWTGKIYVKALTGKTITLDVESID